MNNNSKDPTENPTPTTREGWEALHDLPSEEQKKRWLEIFKWSVDHDSEDSHDLVDGAISYMLASRLTNWCDVADEGLVLMNEVLDLDIESGSPIDAAITAVAAQASHGAYSAVARSLGISRFALELATAAWEENEDLKETCTWEKLTGRIDHYDDWANNRVRRLGDMPEELMLDYERERKKT